ncbi:MAG: hypothetical protein GVY16_06605 [Planctomycetes bacterium]|nr:hypothetical protein [Planctomycetota bacterium]
MTIRERMIAAARRAVFCVGLEPETVVQSLRAQQQEGGAFTDRAGRADLYYTVFGVEGLLALDQPIDGDALAAWLATIDPAALDLVHAAALARVWADLPGRAMPEPMRRALLDIVARHRSDDGGFAGLPACPQAGPYGCFLALGALQDLDAPEAIPYGLADALDVLRRRDGGFPAAPGGPAVLPTTAAAVVTLAQLGQPAQTADADWLGTQRDASGGFCVGGAADAPDLLSTAVALMALRQIDRPLAGSAAEACRQFVLSLQGDDGGFHAVPAGSTSDCEYTFYGLLALGCLEATA